jgi:hypothetical protein
MLLTATPFSIAVGQVLLDRLTTVAAEARVENINALGAVELLPHLLGGTHTESPDIWMRTARDLLVRAQARSKGVAVRMNGSGSSNGSADALMGPNNIQAALEVWAPLSGRTFEERRVHMAGVRIFLEKCLSEALDESQRSAPSRIPPRSLVPEMPLVLPPPPGIASLEGRAGPIPELAGGGLPFTNHLFDQIERLPDLKARLAHVEANTRSIPQPFAMAQMIGGDKLGSFAFANESFLSRFRWTGARRDRLLKMSLMEWYHPEDRALFATISFAIGRMLLGMRPEIKPRPVRGLSGDVLDFWQSHPGARPRDEHYIRYQGAGVMDLKIAFGIFTELPK